MKLSVRFHAFISIAWLSNKATDTINVVLNVFLLLARKGIHWRL